MNILGTVWSNVFQKHWWPSFLQLSWPFCGIFESRQLHYSSTHTQLCTVNQENLVQNGKLLHSFHLLLHNFLSSPWFFHYIFSEVLFSSLFSSSECFRHSIICHFFDSGPVREGMLKIMVKALHSSHTIHAACHFVSSQVTTEIP